MSCKLKRVFPILLFWFFLSPQVVFSQQYFSRELVLADIDTIFKYIRQDHPDMYIFAPREELDRRIEELKSSWPDSLTTYDVYGRLAPVVALIGEGHTNVCLPVESYLARNPYWPETGLYIDKEDLTLQLFDDAFDYEHIISINGRPNKEITEKLLSYIGNETMHGKVAAVNSAMPVIFSLLDSSRVYLVEYLDKDGLVHTTEIKAERIKDRQRRLGIIDENEELVNKPDSAAIFHFSHIDSSTVLFRLPSFDEEQAIPVIDSLFTYLSSNPAVDDLIIDIRGNAGGEGSVCDEIMRYLSPVRFNGFKPEILKHLHKNKKIVRPQMTSPYTAKKRFHGNLYVLMDNGCYSASVLLTHEIKKHKVGTLIGEETGGSIFLHAYPCIIKVTCEIEVRFATIVSHMRHWRRYKRTLETVTPHINVPSEDALDKALEVIAAAKAELNSR